MELKINNTLLERKHFLIRALERHNITKEVYDAEMPNLEKQIKENLRKALFEANSQLIEDVKNAKETIKIDGDFKRHIAKLLIRFLSTHLPKSEIKGVFRQGYKIMRKV